MKKEKKQWKDTLFLNRLVKEKSLEFRQAGYENVSSEDLWSYLLNYRWRKKRELTLAEKKKDITAITFNDYFDYQRIKAQIDGSKEFDWKNLNDLF